MVRLDECSYMDGRDGFLLLVTTAAGAVLLYALGFSLMYSRDRSTRSPFVFFLDLSKIIVGLGLAFGVFILFPPTSPTIETSGFSDAAWYVPIFVVEKLVAVPVAVLLGKLICFFFRSFGRACGCSRWTAALHDFGRYKPTSEEEQGLLQNSYEPRYPRFSWWLIQLIVWSACVIGSRIAIFYVLPLSLQLQGEESVFFKLAQWVDSYDWWPCGKTLAAVIATVAIVDLLHILFVDSVNRYKQTPSLERGTRVRALWKYVARHEDELSFEANEVITIEGEAPDEEQWFKGRIGNRAGLIPATYVKQENPRLR